MFGRLGDFMEDAWDIAWAECRVRKTRAICKREDKELQAIKALKEMTERTETESADEKEEKDERKQSIETEEILSEEDEYKENEGERESWANKKAVDNIPTANAINPMVNADDVSPLPRTSRIESDLIADKITAAQLASDAPLAPAHTSEASQHSLLFNNNVPAKEKNVNVSLND